MSNEWNGNRNYSDFRYIRLAEVARTQSGVVQVEQLRAAGFDADAISYGREVGRLHPIFPAVYAVGHRALSREGWFKAALLSLGDDAALSHFSAAQVLNVWKHRVGRIHVTLPRRVQERERVKLHTANPPTITLNGLRITTPQRVALDMATVVKSDRAYTRVVRELQVQKLAMHEQLIAFAGASKGVPGVRRLRHVLEGGPAPTRSTPEDDLLALLRRNGFPDPNINVDLHGVEVDFHYPQFRVVFEVDGGVHDNPLARADDARKQAHLEAKGERVVRIADHQIADEAQTVARIGAVVPRR